MDLSFAWKLKKYIGLLSATLIGILLFEYTYSQLEYMRYTGADNVVFALQLAMGCSSVGWNGILFPIFASLPMAANYVREYKTGYIKVRFTKQKTNEYITKVLFKNAIMGGLALMIPFLWIAVRMYLDKGLDVPLITESGLSMVTFMTEFAKVNPIGYIAFQAVQVFFCGMAFATLALGISAWVKNEFLTLLLPFAICILVAILTPSHAWDLLLLYCINGYAEASLFPVVVMGAVLMIIGILLFSIGVHRNESDDDKRAK